MIAFDDPRGRHQSIPQGGSSKIVDGVWVFKSLAYCICARSFRAEGQLELDHSDEDRRILTRRLHDEAQDQWWECYKSHQGESGLDALDGSI